MIDRLGVGAAPTALVLAALTAAACWIAARAEALLGERDSQRIVIDEIVGMAVAVAFRPPTAAVLVGGFLLFRAFDVLKIWPAGAVERRVPGGAGVVLDDVVAGIYANLALGLLV